jgi:hypothetical protein
LLCDRTVTLLWNCNNFALSIVDIIGSREPHICNTTKETQYVTIRKKLGTETIEIWYSGILKSVTEHEGVRVLWNKGVQTDREVLANRSDIIVKNKDII